jgi:DNA repair protein RadC
MLSLPPLAGIATVEGLVYATTKELGAIKGISEQKVAKLKEIGELGAGGCW